MCLGIPGKLQKIYDEASLKMGKVDFGGIVKEACLAYVPEVQVGQYVLIHVGFAISVLDEEEAQARLQMIHEIDALGEELGSV